MTTFTPAQLAEIIAKNAAWNLDGRPYGDPRRANLSDADLRRANIRGANLSYADLSGANLSGATLSGANLSGATLSGATLSGANLSYADLSGANLSGADLRRANLSGANLSYADLSGATLSGATLSGADLSGATLSGATLSGANLSGATLSGAIDGAVCRLDFGGWSICVRLTQTTIGCQSQSNDDWLSWTPDSPEIADMHRDAPEWWRVHGDVVKAAIRCVISKANADRSVATG